MASARIECRQVAEIHWKSPESRKEQQSSDTHPGDELKRIDEGERVGLPANVAGDGSDCAARGARGPVRSGRQPGRQEPYRVLSDPVARLDVETQEIRMHFLLLRNEAAHQRRGELSSENSHKMEEC